MPGTTDSAGRDAAKRPRWRAWLWPVLFLVWGTLLFLALARVTHPGLWVALYAFNFATAGDKVFGVAS